MVIVNLFSRYDNNRVEETISHFRRIVERMTREKIRKVKITYTTMKVSV